VHFFVSSRHGTDIASHRGEIRFTATRIEEGCVCRHLFSSGSPLPPSPPADKSTTGEDQARQTSTGDWAGNGN
jgi:hypothetical protein